MVLGKLNGIRTIPNNICKNKLKMHQRLKCKVENYKALRGKHSIVFDMHHSKILYNPDPRLMEIKQK